MLYIAQEVQEKGYLNTKKIIFLGSNGKITGKHFSEPVEPSHNNKSFKDMNNDEKFIFIKPPSLYSESKVQNKTAVSYVGSIISYRNGIVSIMPQNSMRDIRLSIDDIQSISMAGFKYVKVVESFYHPNSFSLLNDRNVA